MVGAVVFAITAAIAAAAVWGLERNRIELARAQANDHASDLALTLQVRIDHALSATNALAAVIRESKGAVRDFDRTAYDLIAAYPGAAALQLAPGGVVTNSYPLAGNEQAIGHDLFADPVRDRAAFKARDTGQLTLAGPFKLVQGGLGAVGRLPVFLDDDAGHPAFWGFATALLRFPEVLSPAHFESLPDLGYQYKLWRVMPELSSRAVIHESSPASLDNPVEYKMKVADATWALGVAPTTGWADPLGMAFHAGIGLVACLLFATVAKLVFDLKSHQAGLEALVARRTSEVAARVADLDRAQSIALVGSWIWDPAHGAIQWSAQAMQMIGASGEPPPADFDAFLRRVPPEDHALVRNALKASLGGHDFDIEHRVLVGGETRWIRQRSSPQLAADGAVSRLTGTFQEITERKRAQEALAAAEARYRGLVEQSLAGIYILQDGRFVYVNPRFAEILGYGSAEELLRIDPLDTAPASDHEMMREHRRRVLDGEVPSFHYVRGAIRKDGGLLSLGVTGTLAEHEGRPAMIGMAQDISDRQRAEEQIKRYVSQLESAMMGAVEMATMMGEMRDPYTAGHQRRVTEVAVTIGRRMGLDPQRLEGLRVAGHLHDVGKITIPAEILAKPGKLSNIEYALVKEHSQASFDVLKSVDFPWPVAQIALQHHERMDGSGYPQGLKGESILLEARILAVADVIEAMSTHRPYRASLGIDKALAEIERGRGTVFDPDVADACLHVFRHENYAIPD